MIRESGRWLIDTSVLIDHLRGVAAATELLRGGVRDGIELASVTVVRTEVLAGMRPREEAATLGLLAALQWLDVTASIADAAGELARRYGKSHRTIDVVDYLIAAAARASGAKLVTLNVKHFPMFPGLRAAYAAPA